MVIKIIFFSSCFIKVCIFSYHKGWLQVQRRRVNQAPENVNHEPRERVDDSENEPINRQERNNIDQTMQPSTVRLIFTFIFKFFTSLIPERPRAIN